MQVAAAHPHGAQPEWRFALECDAAMMSASYSPNKMEADDWTWPLAFPLTVTVTGKGMSMETLTFDRLRRAWVWAWACAWAWA